MNLRRLAAIPWILLLLLPSATAAAGEVDLSSPRATWLSFIRAVNDVQKRGSPEARLDDAVRCMDFGDLPPPADRRRERARQLKGIIDRVAGYLEDSQVPTAAAPWVIAKLDPHIVEIARSADGQWRFTRATVDGIDAFFKEVQSWEVPEGLTGEGALETLRSLVPESLRGKAILLEHWQWIGLLVVIILGVVGDRILVWILGAILAVRLRKENIDTDRKLRRNALRPLGLLAMALIWWMALRPLELPDDAYVVLLIVAKGLAVVGAVWSAYRFVDLVCDYFLRKAQGTETRIDDVIVPLVRKSLKVFITAFGLVFIADNLEVDVSSLLAGLGLGGLAFALAARETVANLFGSVTVLLDRPFEIGDWVQIGDVDGNVEKIGFRSTRVRTFYNSQITVPNSRMITAVVDNLGARRYRRIKTILSITYDTPPESVEAFCEGVREIIRRHPYTRKDYYHVYLNAFSGSSLDVLLYCFVETPDWATELREKHRLYLDIIRLAGRLGVDFAFPTRTLHIEKPGEEPGEAPEPSTRKRVHEAHRLGRGEARQIVEATLRDGEIPPPVVLGAQPMDPELEDRNVGGDEGDG
jgi:MscS family membrane protein